MDKFNTLWNASEELIQEIKYRLKATSGISNKVIDRIEKTIEPNLKQMWNYWLRWLDWLQNDFYTLVDNPNDESWWWNYVWWSSNEIKQLYYVLYWEEINDEEFETEEEEEEEENNTVINEIVVLLNDIEYRDSFSKKNTKYITDKIDDLNKSIEDQAKAIIQKSKDEIVMWILWETDIISAKKRWKEYWDVLKKIDKISFEWLEISTKQAMVIITEQIKSSNNDYKSKMLELQEELHIRKREIETKLSTITQDLSKKDNQILINALNKWWKSPNWKWEKWVDNLWFNAWVVHYFEYMAYQNKWTRINFDSFSVDDFINFTNSITELITNLDSEKVIWYWIYEDDEWNNRTIIYTNDFKIFLFNWKIITFIPSKLVDVDKIKQELESNLLKSDDSNRVNKLWKWKRMTKNSLS